jgi:hypothetical protein
MHHDEESIIRSADAGTILFLLLRVLFPSAFVRRLRGTASQGAAAPLLGSQLLNLLELRPEFFA